MKYIFRILRVYAFLIVIMFVLISCDWFEPENTITMQGSSSSMNGGNYIYSFVNQSDYDIKLTIDGETHILASRPGPYMERVLRLYYASDTITVTYNMRYYVSCTFSSLVGSRLVTFRNHS